MTKVGRRITLGGICCSPVFAVLSWAKELPRDTRGPFGLTWGASSGDVRKLGVSLQPMAKSDYGQGFMATNLPKVLSDTETVVLFFGYRDALWRVAAAGRSVGPDPTGGQITDRYEQIGQSLAEKYGRGTETDDRDHEMWKEPNEYVMSIKEGRANRFTEYRTENVNVELSIRASESDKAYYLIIFEDLFGSRQFESDKKSGEKNSL